MSKSVSWPVVAHHCFFVGGIDALFVTNTGNWSADFAMRFCNTESSLLEELEAMIAKAKFRLVICYVCHSFIHIQMEVGKVDIGKP